MSIDITNKTPGGFPLCETEIRPEFSVISIIKDTLNSVSYVHDI